MSEEQAQQLMQQMQMLETYFTDLSQREGTLLSVLREAISAIESMKSLHQKPNSDTLVPIGMGTYVQTKISSNDKIVLNIGAGIAVEKTYDSTINYLEARIKE
ncbi:MAG: prefoldin subunit alpha, partial [Thermoproteota archaeon]